LQNQKLHSNREYLMANGFVKIKDHSNLVRDRRSGAVLNNDKSAYTAAIQRRMSRQRNANEIQQMKSDISEIKDTLTKLINIISNEASK